MSFKENLKAEGRVKFILTREDGTVKQIMVKNTVVDIGLNHIINRLAADAPVALFGTPYTGLRYEIQTRSDGNSIVVDGGQIAGSTATVVSNAGVDSNELPLLVTGSTIPSDTYITSLTGSTIVNLSAAHGGLSDSDVLQVGQTEFTDIGAPDNALNTAFTIVNTLGNATGTILGHSYEIATAGTTDYTLIGAINSTVGTKFTATGAGIGTGTVYEIASGTGTVRPATMSHMGVGSGTTSQTAADSALETELSRVVLGTDNLQPPSLTYSANFGPGVGSGVITEAAIFNGDSSDADMLCRTTFAAINKGVSDALEVQWIITITRS